MIGISVEIRGYVDDDFPGFVECCFVDSNGEQHLVIEKVPVVTLEGLHAASEYPQRGIIACQIVERRRDATGRNVVLVDSSLPWHIHSTTDETRFEVFEDQVVEFGSDWSVAE